MGTLFRSTQNSVRQTHEEPSMELFSIIRLSTLSLLFLFYSYPDACMHKSVILHETLHALGRFHEHVRMDRDDFIIVNLQNVRQSKQT
jgi:hypothetical protein